MVRSSNTGSIPAVRDFAGAGEGFLLDHDFLFPFREGTIDRFELRLSLDPAWTRRRIDRCTRQTTLRRPGLRCHGAVALQRHRCPGNSRHVAAAVLVQATLLLLGLSALALAAIFAREFIWAVVRFANVDEEWLRTSILSQPADSSGVVDRWDRRAGVVVLSREWRARASSKAT